jgi:hypothetical protein
LRTFANTFVLAGARTAASQSAARLSVVAKSPTALRFEPSGAGYTDRMELLLILVLVAVAVALIMGVRRRRHFNRARGTITGRWNRRL